jgi:hypothetical protein
MGKFLERLLSFLVVVSKHRAGLLDGTSDGGVPDTALEEWLLYKEDCATYFGRQLTALGGGNQQVGPPVFVKSDYQSHAFEEENRLIVTAQSVSRINLLDLKIFLSKSTMPNHIRQTLINYIAFVQLSSEYRARGYAESSPTVGFTPSPV